MNPNNNNSKKIEIPKTKKIIGSPPLEVPVTKEMSKAPSLEVPKTVEMKTLPSLEVPVTKEMSKPPSLEMPKTVKMNVPPSLEVPVTKEMLRPKDRDPIAETARIIDPSDDGTIRLDRTSHQKEKDTKKLSTPIVWISRVLLFALIIVAPVLTVFGIPTLIGRWVDEQLHPLPPLVPPTHIDSQKIDANKK
jgi:hypothetical protein